jgi:hypothetical protein
MDRSASYSVSFFLFDGPLKFSLKLWLDWLSKYMLFYFLKTESNLNKNLLSKLASEKDLILVTGPHPRLDV